MFRYDYGEKCGPAPCVCIISWFPAGEESEIEKLIVACPSQAAVSIEFVPVPVEGLWMLGSWLNPASG